MSGLFRNEAMEHKVQRFHGAVVLTRTWAYPALTMFFCIIILALIGFALAFGFTRKETVSGIVVPNHGLIRVAAPQSGVIGEIYVVEGQEVRAGDPVFVLSSERTSSQGDTQAAINDTLRARIGHVRKELEQQGLQTGNKQRELDQRLQNLQASLALLDRELIQQRRKVRILQDVAGRTAELAKSGAVPVTLADERAAGLIEQEAKISALELERMSAQREIAALAASRLDLPLSTGRAASQLERTIEELKQQVTESEVKREILVRAERPGRIAGIVVDHGQAVAADQRLASLLPAGSALEVELYAPTRAAGFVHAGTEVLLRYDAYPYQKFGQFHGTVREVSQNAIPLAELQRAGAAAGQGAMNATEPVYRIRVRLDSQEVRAAGWAHALKPGMQLSATLVLEHRTLAEWALEPLYGMAGRL